MLTSTRKLKKPKTGEIKEDEIEWNRASWIFGGEQQIFDDKIECSDIKQGSLGNCYFLSSLASLCQYPYLIRQIFRTSEVTPDSYYEVVLFLDGHWNIVVVDDYLPVRKYNKTFAFTKPNGSELWVLHLEKAWAKVNGGYLNIISGKATDPLKALTGFATEFVSHSDPEKLFQTLKAYNKDGHIICTSTVNDPKISEVGLVKSHAYSVLGVEELSNSDNIRLVKLRNPWAHKEWTGDWSDNSKLWTPELKHELHLKNADDGIFYISLTDFVRYFKHSQVCHIMYDCNIKTFRVESDNVRKPHVFNLLMNTKSSKLSISVLTKHWRYNRELRGKTHPFTIVIAEYQLNTKKLVNIEGAFSADENTEYVRFLKKGFYAVWVYCNYDHCQDPKPEEYQVRFASAYKYLVKFQSFDEQFEMVKHMILSGVRHKNNGTDETSEFKENQFGETGIGYLCIFNNSEKDEVHDICPEIKNMSLLGNSDDESNELVVPANGAGICLAMRTCEKSYMFNANSSYSSQRENSIQSTFSLADFVSTEVAQDENEDEDNYYDYFSSSLKKAKDEDD